MKVGVVSLGCVKNRVDTEEMLSFLQKDGFVFTANPEQAEILVVNTCGFINSAKEESIDTILEMAEYKKDGVCQVLCVTGCLSQRYANELAEQIPEIDVMIGVSQYPQLASLINRALAGKRTSDVSRGPDFTGCGRVLTTPPYTAYVRISEGCDSRCTYCTIPLIRGPYRSRPMQDILEEMRTLAEQGAKEQILIAQDTSRYGIDLKDASLASLLDEAAKIPGITWLRVLYCYPDETNKALIDAMEKNPKFCRYLDLPLQHASPRILKAMNRRGDIQQIEGLLSDARARGFALRTTMIVDFPGETEEDYSQLMDFCARVRFDRLGAFTFSPEEDTPAFNMKDQVPEDIKQQRLDALMRMQQEISYQHNQQRIGTIVTVLVTDVDGSTAIARSAFEAPDSDGSILITNSAQLIEGQFVTVEITDATAYDLTARLIKKEGVNEPAQ
ncbi:MAG: 30S ribosomal protein S12 methylthiotransferase RimO [Clostridiales bacterium]|nr:30S ribosomal protein S12 methylthiotransferase RimO [Clostridiales bacterium]